MSDQYNASERRDVKQAAKQARLADRQREEIMQGIMSLPPGRSWMLDILEACHIFASSFTINTKATAFNEGQRSIGLRLLGDIMKACPDQYVQMMRERNERDNTNIARRSNEDTDGGDSTDSTGDGAEADIDPYEYTSPGPANLRIVPGRTEDSTE
jgi:hypothetical protein